MRLTVTKPVEVEVEAVCIRINVPVRYGTEDIPDDTPLRRVWRKGDTGSDAIGRRCDRWDGVVDIDTGRVRSWPRGATASIDMKVCDEGNYTLYDANGDPLVSVFEDYVPACVPGRYGDYIDLTIGPDGVIEGWPEACHAETVRESFFPVRRA